MVTQCHLQMSGWLLAMVTCPSQLSWLLSEYVRGRAVSEARSRGEMRMGLYCPRDESPRGSMNQTLPTDPLVYKSAPIITEAASGDQHGAA